MSTIQLGAPALGAPVDGQQQLPPVTTYTTVVTPVQPQQQVPVQPVADRNSVHFNQNDLQVPDSTRPRSSSTATSRSTASTATSTTSLADGESCVKDKRVKEWQKHFNQDSDEQLQCTHGCALVVSGVMIHGRIYLTDKNLNFRANIVGIRTIPLLTITSIEPKNVAGSIPNAIEVLHNGDAEQQRSLFTTLPKRDHTMSILRDCWKQQAPDAYERGQVSGPTETSTSTTATADDAGYESSSSSSSNATVGKQANGGSTGGDGSTKGPHPATKADTPDLEKQAMHTRLPSDPKKVYELLYHQESFLKGIWEGEGMTNIQVQPWTNGKRTFSYSRPLGGKFGSTKCESEETIIQPDGCEDWWGVEGTTRTPGVPAGKSFLTRSKTVFTYAEGGGTLMHATYQVEWTGKSMLKSTINSSAESGQMKWNELLAKNLRKYIKEHPDEFPSTGNDEDIEEDTSDDHAGASTATTTTTSNDSTPSQARTNAGSGEFDPVGWLMEDPLRAAISAVLVTIITLYLWSMVRGLFGSSTVQITKKRLARLEKIEAMWNAHVSQQPSQVQAGAGAATQTIIKKVVRKA